MTIEPKPGSREYHCRFLRMALELAEEGRGRTSPNPMVGAVVVREGRIVGRGYHAHAGAPHAEVVALRQAGPAARGADLYVNLEPCCHFGRTPPCVERILGSGVRSVIACTADPDPRVDGRGFSALRAGGVEVESGYLEEEALLLNETFARFVRRRRPFLLVKAAVSLDGKLATETGESFWITGPAARRYAHRLRHEYDAVMVGCRTLMRDDPRLTIRDRGLAGKQLTRVVLDTGLHGRPDAALFGTREQGPILIYTSHRAPAGPWRRLEAAGATVIPVDTDRGGKVSLPAVLADLGRRNRTSVLLEGGGLLIGSALRAGLVDKICLFLAPILIGGDRAPGWFRGDGFGALPECPRVERVDWERLGDDFVLRGYPAPPAEAEEPPAAGRTAALEPAVEG